MMVYGQGQEEQIEDMNLVSVTSVNSKGIEQRSLNKLYSSILGTNLA